MTTNDFFLVERASQVQRLRAAKAGNRIDIPGRMSRVGCAAHARQLFSLIDQICAIPLEEKRHKWREWLAKRGGKMFSWRRSATQSEDNLELLTDQHRARLIAFERQIVEFLWDESTEASTAAEAITGAILRDYRNFSGLKPLSFHSANVAYELLFPSWLNLYTALLMVPPNCIESRFSPKQIKTIFRFLHEFEEGDDTPDLELVGALTLLANRQPTLKAHQLIQHIVNLGSLETQGSGIAFSAKIGHLREQTNSVAEFVTLLTSVTIFEASTLPNRIDSPHQLCDALPRFEPLPSSITAHVRKLEQAPDSFSDWKTFVELIANIFERGGCIDGEFAELLQDRSHDLIDWLTLLTPPDNGPPLSSGCQRLLARIIRRADAYQDGTNVKRIHEFARLMGPRLDLLQGPMAAAFEKDFIEQDKNRELLLRSTTDHARRRAISQQLVTHAKQIEDNTRLLSQLTIAAILDPAYDAAKLSGIGRTITVLRMLKDQGFISPNQLEELASDIRRRLPDSLEFLVAPHLGASDQGGRLAKLYLALYEECEKYEHWGEAGNFGHTIAAYGNLNRAIDRDI